jgi:hypothetical protein
VTFVLEEEGAASINGLADADPPVGVNALKLRALIRPSARGA